MARVRELRGHEGIVPVHNLLADPADGAIKLYITFCGLNCRKASPGVFEQGSYTPLRVTGSLRKHVVAFARTLGNRSVLAIAGRFFMSLAGNRTNPIGEASWGDSAVLLPRNVAGGEYRDVFTRSARPAVSRNGQRSLQLAEVFDVLPVSLLESVEA